MISFSFFLFLSNLFCLAGVLHLFVYLCVFIHMDKYEDIQDRLQEWALSIHPVCLAVPLGCEACRQENAFTC